MTLKTKLKTQHKILPEKLDHHTKSTHTLVVDKFALAAHVSHTILECTKKINCGLKIMWFQRLDSKSTEIYKQQYVENVLHA